MRRALTLEVPTLTLTQTLTLISKELLDAFMSHEADLSKTETGRQIIGRTNKALLASTLVTDTNANQ